MKTISLGAVLASALICNVASAQGYLSLGASLNSLDSADFRTAQGGVTAEYNRGLGLRIAIGRHFSSFRGEIELSRYENDVDNVLVAGLQQTGSRGETSALGLMVNGYYDFAPSSRLSPYIGLGIGNLELDYRGFGSDVNPVILEADDAVLGFQFMFGGTYEISDNTSFFGELRVLSTDESTVQTSFETGSVESGINYDSNILQVGVNFRF